MSNYRDSKYIERYEDVVFELETALNTVVANNAHQRKTGYRFVVDNSGETTPFDWYNARFNVIFIVKKLADGADIAAGDRNGIVNSVHALINTINVKMNGIDVYECRNANQATNIKSLLEYSQGYTVSQGTNEFFYLDDKRQADDRVAQVATYNKGFAARKALLNGAAGEVNVELALNRYGFFKSFWDELMPNSKIELNLTLESDDNMIWQAADECRVVLTKFQLIVPRIIFNSTGKSLYMSKYLDNRKWTYMREMVERGNSTRQQTANFRISTGINKPRHVFVFIINDASDASQTANKFLYNTFSVANNRTLTDCYLEVGNGNDYPEVHYKPSTEPTRVFRDVLKYVQAVNDFSESTLLNRGNFGTIFPFVYFDLTKQKQDIKDGMTKLTFKYTLSATADHDYSVYALVLYEQDIEMRKTDGKLILRSM